MEDNEEKKSKYFWVFGSNKTIRIQLRNEPKLYSYTVISYWYDIDKRGRVRLTQVQHERAESIPFSDFGEIHKLLHEAITELKWMSRIR